MLESTLSFMAERVFFIVHVPEHESFVPIETLPGHHIRVNDMQRLVIIDEGAIPCSPGEYRVLLPLLRSPDRVVSFAHLMGRISHPAELLERQSLRRIISRLRAKLWPYGLDIRCVLGQGYTLISLEEMEEDPQAP